MRPLRIVTLIGTLALAGPLTATLALTTADPANADTTGRGPGGQTMTVTKTTNVSRAGEKVTVSGAGYDVTKGIYVAFCVDNGPAAAPGPCGGGADMSGSLGASHWISSNPPSYGEGLAVPYGPGGTFRVQITLTTKIGTVDCTTSACAVVTRNDHVRASDRSQDVRVRISFAAGPAPARTTAKPTTTAPPPGKPGNPGTPGGATPPAPGNGATATTPGGSAPTPGGAGAPSADAGDTPASSGDLQVTRVSSSQTAGGWWVGALIVLAAGLLLVLALRLRRRGSAP